MASPILEMMSFAIVALALVGPKLILWLMVSEPAAQSTQDKRALISPHASAVRVPSPTG